MAGVWDVAELDQGLERLQGRQVVLGHTAVSARTCLGHFFVLFFDSINNFRT